MPQTPSVSGTLPLKTLGSRSSFLNPSIKWYAVSTLCRTHLDFWWCTSKIDLRNAAVVFRKAQLLFVVFDVQYDSCARTNLGSKTLVKSNPDCLKATRVRDLLKTRETHYTTNRIPEQNM